MNRNIISNRDLGIEVEPHDWWDGRMSFTDNLIYNYYLPLICALKGHDFVDWYQFPSGRENAYCERCYKEANRKP